MIKIEDNVPVPTTRRGPLLGELTQALSSMKVGQSFVHSHPSSLYAAITRIKKLHGCKGRNFCVRTISKEKKIYRVWRIK